MALQVKKFLRKSLLEVSMRSLILILASLSLMAGNLEDLKLAPGLVSDVAYEADDLITPGAMDIDPLSGDLFVDNTGAVNPSGSVGHIMRINLAQGSSDVLIPVSNGTCLGFHPDGTLYFGVSNFLLARWERKRNVFRKFAIIPGVRGFDVDASGTIYVGEGSYGPKGLYPDSILEVDHRTGYFKPVFNPTEASADTGLNYNSMASIAVLDDAFYASFKTGRLVEKRGDSYTRGNVLHALIGGLNQTPLYTFGDTLFQYDVAGGQIFAITDGVVRLIAYGDAIRGSQVDTAGMTTDGRSLYVTGDYNRIIEIRPAAGNDLLASLKATHENGVLSGQVLDSSTGDPVAGAEVDLKNGMRATTAEDGSYSLTVPKTLYEVTVSKDGFLKSYANVDMGLGDLEQNLSAATGLPNWLAPGLVAEVWARPEDGIVGSCDAQRDKDGNIYSMNIAGSSITKHYRDPETGAMLRTEEFAYGDGLAGAWSLAVDDENNVWCSNGNDGVMRLPALEGGEAHVLTADPSDPSILRNQRGQNVNELNTRDVDGVGILSDGSLVMTSGSGGDPSPPCFPEGTVDSILKQSPGASCPTIISRGVPCEGGEDVISNPDIMRVDALDRVWHANRGGNVARVDMTTGCVDWWLPGDGNGIEEHALGSYTSVGPDTAGNIFLRGVRFAPEDNVIRIYEDGKFYMVVGGTLQCFGGFTFPKDDGSELIYCDGETLIRVYTESGEPIADVVKANVEPE